jgi:hypothetical protein
MKSQPMILHIDLGNQSLYGWVKENNYIIFSELIRYAEKLIKEDLEEVQALMISNLLDNIVFLLRKEDVKITLQKALDYFLSIEEYEQCVKIRNLFILIEKVKNNETKNITNSKRNQRHIKGNR